MSEVEQVLVVPRALFEELGAFQGAVVGGADYLAAFLDADHQQFLPRPEAEEDPSFKQLIPYVLFHHEGRYLHYYRGKAGGEARLHAKGSIGVGGHINPIDQQPSLLGAQTYQAGVERELAEELVISGPYDNDIVGLINDDSNDVGKVHLGIVHLVELSSDDVQSNEDALAGLSFKLLEELKGDAYGQLETWSQLCVDHFLSKR